MAEVRYNAGDSLNWERLGDLYPPEMRAGLDPAHAESAICTHEPGLDGSLHLQEYKFLPGASVSLHAHDLPEIIYVIEGLLKVGNRMMAPGSSIYVGAETLYSFAAGDEGCRLLIFMASGIYKYFDKDALKKREAEKRAEAAA
jgi:quercetin dioxygenase-like cupin family protein